MSFVKSLSAVAVIGAAASAASAAIVPSWRVNPISSAAIAARPDLANAISVSLMVELTGGSLFNVAGVNVQTTGALAGASIVQVDTLFGANDFRPSAALIGFAPAVEFDSYVHTTDANATPAVPGKYQGTGAAELRSTSAFNVSWGATPNTGGSGLLEIARITFLGAVPGFTAVPGEVRDNLNPNAAVALPPIPVAVPEPTMGLALAGLGLLALRRK